MLYLIGGDNVYESSQRLEEIKKDFQNRFDGDIYSVDADEVSDFREIFDRADSLPLFSRERLIVIKRLLQQKSFILDQVLDYLKSSKRLNFIFWEDKALDKRRGIYKFIKKKGVVEECAKLNYPKLKSWLSKFIGNKVNYEPQCIDELLFKIGDNQMELASTIENLVNLVKSRRERKLKKDHVQIFVEKTAEENIWEFIDAIAEYNKAKALDIIERLVREKGDFVMVVGMLARQFRILSLVKFLIDQNKSFSEISSALRLHPFVIRKSISHCKNFTIQQLRKLYQKLVKTDLVVKQGRFDEKLALDLLIAAI